MKKTLWIAGALSVLGFASIAVHAKSACDIHHLGYTKAQCDECTNMTWSVSRIFPKGECVSTAPQQQVNLRGAPASTPAPPPKILCDIHHLGYTQAECDRCSNMRWSTTKYTPQGECTGTTPPAPINLGGAPGGSTGGGAKPTQVSSTCTPTGWGGATLPLNAPNFSGTGARVNVCSRGFDFSKSRFQCSTGNPTPAFNAPTTNITCNHTASGPGANPQVTINGTPCCL